MIGFAVDRHDVPLDVHAHRAGLQHAVADAGVVGVGAAAQHRPDAGDQLARRVRLGDVVVGAELQPDDLVDLAVARGHHDHRHARPRPQLLAHVGAAHPGQHQVQQHDVGTGSLEFGEGRGRRPPRWPRSPPCAAETPGDRPGTPRPPRSTHWSLVWLVLSFVRFIWSSIGVGRNRQRERRSRCPADSTAGSIRCDWPRRA